MLLHKKCTFLGFVLMLLGIIVARFVIVSPNAVFDYFFYLCYWGISSVMVLIILFSKIYRCIGNVIHIILLAFLLFQCLYSCFNVYYFLCENNIEIYNTYISILIRIQKIYVVACLIIAFLSMPISFLLNNTKSKDMLFIRVITILYPIAYVVGQYFSLPFHNEYLQQIAHVINVYVLELFPVLYFLSIFKYCNQR